MEKYYITDETFAKILMHLRSKKRGEKEEKEIYCKNHEKIRTFIEGVYYILITGAQWPELPKYYGTFKSVHKRFLSWARRGIWNNSLSFFAKDCDVESVMLDDSIVRAHACASGYKKGQQKEQALERSKGGFITKIHTLVDTLRNPFRFILMPGQAREVRDI